MGNAYGKSGLIVIKKSYLYMYDTYISGARSIDTAGVINIDKESTVEIYRCTFEKNSATGGVLLFNEKNETGDGDGGAIVIEKGATNVIIKDSIFKSNTAKNRGGALYIESATSVTIDNCSFEANTAGYGSNIYCYSYPSRLTIQNCAFEVTSTIQTNDIEFGEDEYIKITVDDGTNNVLNPTYTITVNGEDHIITSDVTIKGLSVGNYTAVLSAGDVNSNRYTFTESSSMFIVGTVENIEVTATYTVNADGTISIKIIDEYDRVVSNRQITVTINNTVYPAVTNQQGVAVIAPELNPGNYTITLEIENKIISNDTPTTIEIVDYTTTPLTDTVSVTYSYNDDGTINILVLDDYSRPINNTQVILTINGISYTADSDSTGVAVINPSKNVAGEYLATIVVSGKTVTSVSSETVKVIPQAGIESIVAENLTRAQNSQYDFKARFLDKNANPLNNKTVTFIYNGNEYNVVTDEFGYAVFKNSLLAGTYTITSFNPATNERVNSTVTIVGRITGNKNINMDYSYSAAYTVRVYADNGQPAGAGEKVVFKIDGKNAETILTDSNGYAKLTVKDNKLVAKTHKITASYKGVTVTNNLVVKKILKAKNAKYKRYRLKVYTATLKTSQGKAIKNKKITFKFNGKTYKAKTNKKGVAKITIKKFWKVGTFKIKITYLKTTLTKKITVKG